jgi:hypothetical protein
VSPKRFMSPSAWMAYVMTQTLRARAGSERTSP